MVASNSSYAACIILAVVFALAVHIPGCRAISPFYKRLLRENRGSNGDDGPLNDATQLVGGSTGDITVSNTTSALSATTALDTNKSILYNAHAPEKGTQKPKVDVDDSNYGRKTYTDIACSQYKTCRACVSDPDCGFCRTYMGDVTPQFDDACIPSNDDGPQDKEGNPECTAGHNFWYNDCKSYVFEK